MTAARGIKAGSAYVELLLADGKFARGLQMAQTRFRKFGKSLASIGGLFAGFGISAAAGLVPMIRAASDAEEGINKFNSVFGSQAKQAEAFAQEMAEKVGRSVIDIRDSMSSFQGMFSGLGFGEQQAREMSQAMQELSLDFASFNNLSDEEASQRFLAGLSGSSEVFDKFGINTKAAALDQKLLEMGLAESTAKASEQQKVMARMAIIMESMGKQGAVGDAVKTAGSFANQLKRLQSKLKDAGATIGQFVLPVLAPLVGKLSSVAGAVAEWVKENPGLVVSLLKIAGVVAAAGAGLLALGGVATAVGAIFGSFAGLLSAAGAAFGLVTSLVMALLSPIGLVAAAVVGLGGYFVYASGAGAEALDWLMGKFGPLKDDALAAFDAIKSALSEGDFQAAANILWAGLKVAWAHGVAALREAWERFKQKFMEIATEAWYGAAIGLNNALSAMETGWVETVAFFKDAWATFSTWLLQSWNKISGAISKAWARVKAAVKGTSAEAEIKRIDAETKRKNEAADDARNKEISKRLEETARRRSEIDELQNLTNQELARTADETNAQRKAAADEAVQQANDELAKARQEFQDSLKAHQAAKPGEKEPGKEPKKPGEFDPQKFAEQFQGGIKTAMRTESKANTGAVLGTDEGTKALFSAFRFAGGDPADQTAKNTKAMADEMKRMKQEQKKTNEQLKNAPVAKLEKV
jgi:hypothetical protein